ncbi:MAG: saccharopine dehydrogenase NADP-binding domain-containing protein [Candidatus Eisenbacteria bacterium]|nr:saccharopine dehydrogenase NADP-binding domain-containing protein [Candidatus Eisenbacteria bacterium]
MGRIAVLGAGMVGSAIAKDLARTHRVVLVDRDRKKLAALAEVEGIETRSEDLSREGAVRRAVEGADLVVGAVPGFLGFGVLRAILEAGKDAVDISFFPEDPFDLDDLAKKNNATVVIDCGVAPGMSNILLGHHAREMRVDFFECLVGGLPVRRSWPHQYKAPFSPIDVVEEYTRPVRMKENGKIVVKPALSEPELVEIDPIGTLEASNTDGLRTLLRTTAVPDMKEKTLRYPGHFEYMRVLLESGFFGKEPIEVGEARIRPIDFTARLLFPLWRLAPGEADITVMRVRIRGDEGGKKKEHVYRLFDRLDEKTGISSMARTTGYTSSAVANLLLDGRFTRKGICPPEYVGAEPGCLSRVFDYLADRGVLYEHEAREPRTEQGFY